MHAKHGVANAQEASAAELERLLGELLRRQVHDGAPVAKVGNDAIDDRVNRRLGLRTTENEKVMKWHFLMVEDTSCTLVSMGNPCVEHSIQFSVHTKA